MKENILITVKTYPVLSRKYAELVCTAGVNDSGEWRRIYPIRFRQLHENKKYKKYQWITAEITKSDTDKRPETYKIINPDTIQTGETIDTKNNWEQRRIHFIDKVPLHNDLSKLISKAHNNELSLALFKPNNIIKFTHKKTETDWDKGKLDKLKHESIQGDLFFDEKEITENFDVVKKLPYKFSYCFNDINGKESTLMVEDWEIGALYWNCFNNTKGNEKIAVEKVKQKYFDSFVKRTSLNTLFVLGTTLQHHNKKAPNPFVIISVIPLPLNRQQLLF